MPPILIHKDAPIAPATGQTADGVTPKTSGSNSQDANPPPTRTTPAHIPATTTASSSNPPPPQPGARPSAPTATFQSTDDSTGTPAAPQPGATPGGSYTAHHITTETRQQTTTLPSQTYIPPPQASNLPTHSTTTSTQPSFSSGPVSLNAPGAPAPSPYQHEHKGGAVPQPQAEGQTSLEHPPGYVQAPDNSPYAPMNGGIGGGAAGGGGDGAGPEGVGGAAWNMLAKAGEALKKGEEAAWKAVRNNQ